MDNVTPKGTRNWILALLFMGWALGNLDRYIMNYAILSITQDLHLSSSSTGILLSSFFAGYAFMQLPGGWLADRFGPRKVLLASVIGWSIFTGMTGAAWSLASMIVIRFLFGIGEGGFQPSASKIIALAFPQEERGRAMSVMLSSGGIMALLVPIASAALLTTIGWRAVFVVMGLAGVAIAALYWHYIKLPDEEQKKGTSPAGTNQKSVINLAFKTPIVWNLLIAYFCIYSVNWGLMSWIPTYLVKTRGLDLISLGWLQTIPGVTMLLGIYVSGYIVDKLSNGRDKLAGAFSCACIGILLYLMFTASNVTAFITYQTIVNLFISFVVILLPAIILKKFPASVTGTTMGIANTGGQLAGFVTPMAIGFIVDAFNGSFVAAFWMLIAYAVICIGALLTMNDKKGALLVQENEAYVSQG